MQLKKTFVCAGVVVAVLLGVAIAAASYYVATFDSRKPFTNRAFNRELWQANATSTNPENPRGEMAADLRIRLAERKLNRSQVIQLLGPPDFGSTPKCLQYNLGAWSGDRIDYDSFDICFDSTGHYQSARVHQH